MVCSWSQDRYVVRKDWQSRGLAMAAALFTSRGS